MKSTAQRKTAPPALPRPAYRSLQGWALGILIEHGAVTECEHHGHRLAYTILPGIVERPQGARVVRRDGLEIALYRDGEHDVAVFERDGRTCVLAGHVLRTSTLVKLAASKV